LNSRKETTFLLLRRVRCFFRKGSGGSSGENARRTAERNGREGADFQYSRSLKKARVTGLIKKDEGGGRKKFTRKPTTPIRWEVSLTEKFPVKLETQNSRAEREASLFRPARTRVARNPAPESPIAGDEISKKGEIRMRPDRQKDLWVSKGRLLLTTAGGGRGKLRKKPSTGENAWGDQC